MAKRANAPASHDPTAMPADADSVKHGADGDKPDKAKPAAKEHKDASLKERHLAEFKQQMALERFQEERPQLWLQSQRVGKLIEIQNQLDDEVFPEGSCFLHANLVGSQSFCVKRLTGIDLDTCQVTLEIYGDEDLEGGIVVLPLETIEWFGFPAKAVSMGVHFEGFTHISKAEKAEKPAKDAPKPDPPPKAEGG